MWIRLQTGFIGISMLAAVGCSNLPGNAKQQGAVIGGTSGAAIGAAVSGNRALGAIIGGAVGAAGGYAVGANKDKIFGHDPAEAQRKAEQSPATAQEARNAATADVNQDGYVTLDEVVALQQAGYTEGQILDKLRATNQAFQLTAEQKQYLIGRGLSANLVNQIALINPPVVGTQPQPTNSVISGTSPNL